MEEPENSYAADDPRGLDFTPVTSRGMAQATLERIHRVLTVLLVVAMVGVVAWWLYDAARGVR